MIHSNPIRGIYAIVDAGICAGEDLVALARDYLEGGLHILQYRHKKRNESPEARKDYLKTAVAIAELKEHFDFTYVINDDLEAMMLVDADAIHVGQDDLSIEKCREKLGSRKIIGYSSHSLEEALEAERRGADYVAFGAIFPTPTKGPGHPVQGIARLREVVQGLGVPVVAIGGIGRSNIREVLETGAASVAMISAITRAGDSRVRRGEISFFSSLFHSKGG